MTMTEGPEPTAAAQALRRAQIAENAASASYPPSLWNFATGATAGTPGTWTPGGSIVPASPAAVIAGTPRVIVASPASNWTVGQYVQTLTAGAPGQVYWNGTAWVAGAHP